MRSLIVVAAVVSACTVGSSTSGTPPGGGNSPDAATQGGVDAPSGISPDAAGSGSGSGSGSNGCINQVTANLGDGHHNPGTNCMNGCHNHGFTIAGTIYTSATSNSAVTGATVTVTDANGQVLHIVSQLNGNFYTSTPVTYPLTVNASSCPSISKMTAQVASGGGACAQNGCHATGGQGQIHIP
jgi:hypothetical protein